MTTRTAQTHCAGPCRARFAQPLQHRSSVWCEECADLEDEIAEANAAAAYDVDGRYGGTFTLVCDGQCLSAADLGLPAYERDWPAYPDTECSLHGQAPCTCGHIFADHHDIDGCGGCALAYNQANPRHDFTPRQATR